uniref:Uncharacterized protein n=1 Tax=Physcomitrium patens TaxID=3218 RepID=A0A7I4BHL7_PHYPA
MVSALKDDCHHALPVPSAAISCTLQELIGDIPCSGTHHRNEFQSSDGHGITVEGAFHHQLLIGHAYGLPSQTCVPVRTVNLSLRKAPCTMEVRCEERRTSSILCKHHFFAHLLLDVIDNSTNSVISIEGSLHLKLLHKVIEA